MASTHLKSRSMRTVGAIVGKDLTESIKNKDILMVFGTIAFLIALYFYLPQLSVSGEVQRVRLYDAGSSAVAERLEPAASLRVFTYESEQAMLDDLAIASYDSGELGLVVPADGEQTIAAGGPLRLEGYLMHWVTPRNAETIRSSTERRLSQQLGVPVTLTLAPRRIDSRPDSMGHSLFSANALTLIFVLTGIMMAPRLIMEERENRTLDALLVSPARYSHIVLGKALTALCFSLLTSAAVVAVNRGIIVQWWLLALAAVWGTLFSVAVGLLLGLLFENKQQLTLWLMVIMQPLLIPVFLNVMVDLIPPAVIRVFQFVPPVALSNVIRYALTPSAPFSAWAADFALVVVSTVGLLAAAVWVVRRTDR